MVVSTVAMIPADAWNIREGPNRQIWYANGRWWILYLVQALGSANFTSTADGTTWTAPAPIPSGHGSQRSYKLNVFWDGSKIHFAQVDKNNTGIYYWQGTCNADGTITWTTTNVAITIYESTSYPALCVDSSGFPNIAYSRAGTGANYIAFMKPSINASGTAWGTEWTQQAPPITGWNRSPGVFLRMGSGWFAMHDLSGGVVESFYWHGPGNPINPGDVIQQMPLGTTPVLRSGDWAWCGVGHADGPNNYAYLVYVDASNNLKIMKWWEATQSWSASITLKSGINRTAGQLISPCITRDAGSAYLYVYWVENDATSSMQTIRYIRINESDSPDVGLPDPEVVWISECPLYAISSLNCIQNTTSTAELGVCYIARETATGLYFIRFSNGKPYIAPTATIDEFPTTPNKYNDLVLFHFKGTGTPGTGSIVSYEWVDVGSWGSFVFSSSADFSYYNQSLPPGDQTIKFRVKDSCGRYSDYVTMNLTLAYLQAILDAIPPDPSDWHTPMTFTGHGDITGSGVSVASYQWSSSISGLFSTSPSVTTSALDVGFQDITFTVSDTLGQTAVVVISSFGVRPPKPVAVIDTFPTSPVGYGVSQHFAGHGITLSVISYGVWTSSIDGVFSFSQDFFYALLTGGDHTITFQVVDDFGQVSDPVTAALIVFQILAYIDTPQVTPTKEGGGWTLSAHCELRGTGNSIVSTIWYADGWPSGGTWIIGTVLDIRGHTIEIYGEMYHIYITATDRFGYDTAWDGWVDISSRGPPTPPPLPPPPPPTNAFENVPSSVRVGSFHNQRTRVGRHTLPVGDMS